MRKADKQRMDSARDYINSHYFIRDFLVEKGLLDKNSGVDALACFKNNDKTPSMKFTFEKNLFKCFSCGNGGSYVKMVIHFREYILGEKVRYSAVIEEILRSDQTMQSILGFTSIFTNVKKEIKLERRKLNRARIVTYAMLSERIKELPIDRQLRLTRLVQEGITPEELEKFLDNNNVTDNGQKDLNGNYGNVEVDVEILDIL